MYRLGIIEESLNNKQVLRALEPYIVNRRTECIPDDPSPVWHINEYEIPDEQVAAIAEQLRKSILPTWYIHAFNDKRLIVVLMDRCFEMSLHRDHTWNDMIAYGVQVAHVERHYLESIPLRI